MKPISDFNAPRFDGVNGRDVTIGVVYDVSWDDLRPYAVSLVRSGFTGLKLLIVDQSTHPGVRENFTRLGFTIVERITPEREAPGQWDELGWTRFYYAAAIHRNNPGFRNAIWSDVRDVVFQVNPSTWLENNLDPDKIAIEGLGHTLGACPIHNGPWVQLLCSTPEEWERLRVFEGITTGAFAGNAKLMQSFMDSVYSICCRVKHPNSTDQGVMNYLTRTFPYNTLIQVPAPREGFSVVDAGEGAAWVNTFTEPVQGMPTLEDGVLLSSETKRPIAIAHLYTRVAAWREAIHKKYSE